MARVSGSGERAGGWESQIGSQKACLLSAQDLGLHPLVDRARNKPLSSGEPGWDLHFGEIILATERG